MAYTRQGTGSFCGRNVVAEAAARGIAEQVDIGQRAAAAVGARECAGLGNHIAVGEHGVAGTMGNIQRPDAEAGEREQFVAFADTVLVQITPDAQGGEPGILGIDPAVAVVVQFDERRKAVERPAGAGIGVIAEQFGTGINAAVAIAIEHQQAIVGRDPAAAVGDAVAIVIEQHAGGMRGGGFEAVAVEIKAQGVVALDGVGAAAALAEFVDEVGGEGFDFWKDKILWTTWL